MRHYDYNIADTVIRSDRDLVTMGLRGFKPFAMPDDAERNADCTLHFIETLTDEQRTPTRELSNSYVVEANADGVFSRTKSGYLYSIKSRGDEREATLFHIDTQSNSIVTNIVCETLLDVSLLRFGLWMMFGVVLAPRGGIAIHSSAIACNGRAAMFLGESGTGKSTHTRLWRENIEGAKLLNDDSPILRIVDDEVRIYGSPWSGKTPCYKNVNLPIAGICRLSQAPHNKIRPLGTIAAIGALLPSCPPQYAHDDYLQDAICATLGRAIRKVRVYHMECLPNGEAAHLSHNTMMGDE